jgi:RNA polymerase sigma factor (sigma-70 family)
MDVVGQMTDFRSNEIRSHVSRIVDAAGLRLMRFIRARVANETDAEDILQDVWQQLVTTLEDGPVEHVAAWLYTVARNRIIDRYRKPRMASLDALAAEIDPNDTTFEIPDSLLGDASTPESESLRHLFWEQLHAALAELPQEQRQVFVWHELEGLSFQEIAELTGEKVNTLLSRKRYAVLHLRQQLQHLRHELLG